MGALAPPAQYASAGQGSVLVGDVEPAGQKVPGAAAQLPEQAGVERPGALPKVPGGQGVQEVEFEA